MTGGFPDTDSGRQIDGASTVFMGPGVDFSPGAGPERVAVPVPRGTARHLRVHAVRQPQGPNVTLTFTVMNNTAHPFNPHVPQLECSMSPRPFPSGPTLQDCEDLVDELDFDAGDRLYLKVTASSRSVPLPPPIDANAITWSVELH